MTNTTVSRVALLGGVVATFTLALAPSGAQAQEEQVNAGRDAPTVLHACYVPTTGLVYRIKAEGLPETCRGETHVAFSWSATPAVARPTDPPVPLFAAPVYDDDGIAWVGTLNAGTIPLEGAGVRMLWYPKKAAFRVGQVTGQAWNDKNIGYRSFAMGMNTLASKASAMAMGSGTQATARRAVAIGYLAEATGENALALGNKVVASGLNATAFGYETAASGDNATAMGFHATAQAFGSVALGRYNLLAGSPGDWVDTDPLLVAGNGASDGARSNALTLLKNGNLTLAGIVESESGGFKFPDGTVQTTAASAGGSTAWADLTGVPAGFADGVDDVGASDHGVLGGLVDDDHTQYLLASGARALSGSLSAGNNKLTNLAAATTDGDAVRFEQAVLDGDAAGGDLSGTYPDPSVAKLQAEPVSATTPTNGQVLTYTGATWEPQTPAAGVTDHGALGGLTDDDHEQYLLATGARALSGPLSAGNNKLTNLAAATTSGDAVRFEQAMLDGDAAGGDLSGAYPDPTVSKLQAEPVSATTPTNGQVLTYTGTTWEPQTPASGVSDHGGLAGLADDDHDQYLLANGVRDALNGFAVSGTYGTGSIPVSGGGTRLMWYPKKAALRVGQICSACTDWNDANIGGYSVAMGYGPKAGGNYAFALGQFAEARGHNSAAIGYSTDAFGDYAMAIGRQTNATGDMSLATGYSTAASGNYATAMGFNTVASQSGATAMGRKTTASGLGSTAMGSESTASGWYATAIGEFATAQAYASVALGRYNLISGDLWSWVDTDPLFVVGNGTSSVPANALTLLKNGNLTIAGDVAVGGEYLQLPTVAGTPPAADCDEASEAGRLVVRTDGSANLYICLGTTGWVAK